ncbi:sigma factor-like helix-turn-helix DNA-binding protein [Streptomyces sp. RLB1-33]|uniref:helix-turn-helix domain-containing protein n=1 Tax=Streptomyces mirabilis TaxID=68239 RepID=UPI00143E42A8|nr:MULTISPECIES: helix-turn-helix domain-containing protein [Streptomyces]QIY72948.1 helix-turn-helix domain-containing protein [Streptomyces sp. RLB1-33]QUW80089.1 helix-turn-helix domain-containing protein [Streptomyces mirabilis]
MTRTPETPLPSPKERRRLREAQSLSQADIAAAVGVTRATVHSWENGRTTPSGSRRDAYARLLTGTEEVTTHQENPAPALVGAATGPVQASPDHAETTPEPPSETPPASELALEPKPELAPEAELEPLSAPLTPDQAFDALYAFCAPALVRQTYLLTGRRELARESVERAFQLAWHRWPEVAMDRDPAGWVRATAHEFALSPWHRLRPRHRDPEPPPTAPADRALLDVLLQLPPVYRRTLLLYDGVGLDLPETAAETEASTPAAANRLLHAREAVAKRLPELAEPKELHRRLAEVASAERLRAAKPTTVRWGGEQRARHWTRAAIAFTVVLIGATTLTLRTAPDHYEPPLAPGATVLGVPPRVAPGPLSAEELALRAKLKGETASGPERLVPEPG